MPDQTYFIAEEDFYIYGSAMLSGNPTGMVVTGAKVTVIDQFGGYLYVSDGSQIGYCAANQLSTSVTATYASGRTQGEVSGTTVTGGATVVGGNTGSGTDAGSEAGSTADPNATPDPNVTVTPTPTATPSTWDNIKTDVKENVTEDKINDVIDAANHNNGNGKDTADSIIGAITGNTPTPTSTPAVDTSKIEDAINNATGNGSTGGGLSASDNNGVVVKLAAVSGQIQPMLATGTVLTDDAPAYLNFLSRGETVQAVWYDSASVIVWYNGVYGSVDPRVVQFPGKDDYTLRDVTLTDTTVLYRNFNMTEEVVTVAAGTEVTVLDEFGTCALVEVNGRGGYMPVSVVTAG